MMALKKLPVIVLLLVGCGCSTISVTSYTFPRYKKLAMEGDAEAQYVLARCYYKAIGVELDLNESLKWLHKSAEQGYEEAVQAVSRMN